jgi:hypothetical protein
MVARRDGTGKNRRVSEQLIAAGTKNRRTSEEVSSRRRRLSDENPTLTGDSDSSSRRILPDDIAGAAPPARIQASKGRTLTVEERNRRISVEVSARTRRDSEASFRKKSVAALGEVSARRQPLERSMSLETVKDDELLKLISFNTRYSSRAASNAAARIRNPLAYFGLMPGLETAPAIDPYQKLNSSDILADFSKLPDDICAATVKGISFNAAVILTSVHARRLDKNTSQFQFILYDSECC